MRRVLLGLLAVLLLCEVGTRLVETRFAAAVRHDPWYESDAAWNLGAIGQHLRNLGDLEDPPRVVVVGSSTAGAAVDASMLHEVHGIPAYNAWVVGAGTRTVTELGTQVVLPRTRPEVVVVALGARDLDEGEADATTGALTGSAGWRALTDDGVGSRIERRARSWSAFVRYRALMRSPADLVDAARGNEIWGNEEIDARGTLRRDRRPPDARPMDVYEAQERAATEGFRTTPEMAATLRALLRDLGAGGRAVVLAEVPYSGTYVGFFPRGDADIRAARELMREVAAEEGVPFVDAEACSTWTDADFGDPNHLGARGRPRLTACVADTVRPLL